MEGLWKREANAQGRQLESDSSPYDWEAKAAAKCGRNPILHKIEASHASSNVTNAFREVLLAHSSDIPILPILMTISHMFKKRSAASKNPISSCTIHKSQHCPPRFHSEFLQTLLLQQTYPQQPSMLHPGFASLAFRTRRLTRLRPAICSPCCAKLPEEVLVAAFLLEILAIEVYTQQSNNFHTSQLIRIREADVPCHLGSHQQVESCRRTSVPPHCRPPHQRSLPYDRSILPDD